MRHITGIALACLAVAGTALAAEPIHAVVITGDHPFTEDTFLAAFQDHEGIVFTHAPQQNHEEIFDNILDWPYDVMVFYHFSMAIPPHRVQNLLALIDQGVGLVLLHHGGMTYWNVEELRDIYGVRWDPPTYAFHLDQDYTARIADPDHPITRGIEDFDIHDETYTGYQRLDYPGNHVLITAEHPKSDPVIAWARRHGPARIVGYQQGHDSPAFTHPTFKTLLGRMTRWAAGRLPETAGGPVLEDTTLYRETREGWLDQAMVEDVAGGPGLARDTFHRRALAALNEPAARTALATRLAGLLERDGTDDGRRFILRKLTYLRCPGAAGPVIGLLDHPALAQEARRALEAIPGAEVDAALAGALEHTEGRVRAGLLRAIAKRGGEGALPLLAARLADPDRVVAKAAVEGLGWLGTPEAAEALRARLDAGRHDAVMVAALLNCAARADAAARAALLKAIPADRVANLPAPLRQRFHALALMVAPEDIARAAHLVAGGDEAAVQAAIDHLADAENPAATAALAEALPATATDVQVWLLSALRQRGDASAREAVLAMARSDAGPVRLEAVRTLAAVGDARDLPLLSRCARSDDPEEAKSARAVLASLPGLDAPLAAMAGSSEASEAVLALETLAERDATDQLDAALVRLDAEDTAVRAQAWRSAGWLAAPDQLPALQSRVTGAEDTATVAAEALARVARRADDTDAAVDVLCDHAYPDGAARAVALTAVASLGTDHALARLTGALDEPSPDVQAAALRALAAWDTAAPAEALMQYAASTGNADLRETAIQAATAHFQHDGNLAPAELVRRIERAYAMADTVETREAVLEAAGRCGDPDGFALLRHAMDDPALAKPAMRATLRLARALAADAPDRSIASLRHVVERTDDEGFRAEAAAALRDIEEYRGRLFAHWGFDTDLEGWVALKDCAATVEDGVLRLDLDGIDPIISTAAQVPAGPVLLVMRARFDIEGVGQVFWYHEGETDFTMDSPFVVFDLQQNEPGWIDFSIPMNLERPMAGFRIDPGAGTGTALIDYIRIERPVQP